MWKKVFNIDGLKKAMPLLAIILSILFLAYGIFGTFENDNWAKLLMEIGKMMLTGGVFAVLLKSMQFMGVFKEEITNIIYEPKFLSNRKDLPLIWQKISKALFEDKFSQISDKLLNDVKEIYLPTNEVSYYDNAEHHVEFRIEDKKEGLIKIIDTASLNIICESEKIKTFYEFGYGKVNVNGYKLLEFKIDGLTNFDSQTTTNTIGGVEYEIVKTELLGKVKYKIEKKSERIINLNEDNISAFRAKKIFNGLKIQIHHDENIKLELLKSGTLNEFELKKTHSNFKEYDIEGLIYPEQGYYVSLKIF